MAKSAPGLRDYRKRLDDLPSKDPFNPQYTEEDDEGEGEEGEGSTTDHRRIAAKSPAKKPAAPKPGAAPTETTADNPDIIFYSFAIDVRVAPVSAKGKPSKAEPEVRRTCRS